MVRGVSAFALLAALFQSASASYSYKSAGICMIPRNVCTQIDRCRLANPIAQNDLQPPAWANEHLQRLFARTIEQARNGTLQMDGVKRFQPEMVCWDSDTRVNWFNDRSSNEGGCQTAWGNLGYHPYGKEIGTWLTLIAGNSTGSGLVSPQDFYVSITRISEERPYTDAFDTYASLAAYVAGVRTYRRNPGYQPKMYAEANSPFSSIRTGNDLEANGFDIACCNPESICYPYQLSKSGDGLFVPIMANFTLTHIECRSRFNTSSSPAYGHWSGSDSGSPACSFNPLIQSAPKNGGSSGVFRSQPLLWWTPGLILATYLCAHW
jgi:hypothetical protein